MDDKVVDSRTVEEGASIRRRRECLACGRRYTTYERLEELPFVVIKRDGSAEPFNRAKIIDGVKAAAKNRPVSPAQMEALAAEVEEQLRLDGNQIPTETVGVAVLARLRRLDEVAYVRFASVYKEFSEPGDFTKEVGSLVKHDQPGVRTD